MAKTVVFVHGRSFKPGRADLEALWLRAVRHGIERDRPGKLASFDRVRKEFVYYGDLSNAFLRSRGKEYSMASDVADRKRTIESLEEVQGNKFTKAAYNKLPGKSSWKEGFGDVLSYPLGWLGLTDNAINAVAPDMGHYWDEDEVFGSRVRARMARTLQEAMDRGDRIMIVSHSLGTIVAYDTLWKLSRSWTYKDDYWAKKVDLLVTLGSPLADDEVRKHLRGAGASGERKYPSSVKRWENVAAEDDFISHDKKVKNDFKKMLRARLVGIIRDQKIYNLAVRNGRSNPHSSAGYLMAPKVTKLISDWI